MTSHNPSNIVLIGFMASGKSRIGEMLAKRMGYHLFDVDSNIEKQEGLKISQIFCEKGEEYFRKLETKAIKNLKGKENLVIVTGGGTPLSFENCQILKSLGTIYFLDASFSLILQRLKRNRNRPLAKTKSGDDIEKIRNRYNFRRPIYLQQSQAIDVNLQDKEKTCDEIIERFRATIRLENIPKIVINDLTDPYPIFIVNRAMDSLSHIIAYLGLKNYRPVIVTSTRLSTILSKAIDRISRNFQNYPSIITFEDGEQHKNYASVKHLHDQMFRLGLTRNTLILAVGGGNVGDVAGFSSAIYLRGIPVIQIPTTLLAMVDASIGGKTGIDNEYGKNLIGSFYNPRAVIIDSENLKTLPKDDFNCGIAEIIKHGIIGDKKLFTLLKKDVLDIDKVIERALLVKANIVFDDPKENNIRAHLNLGHTFAHAIEKVSDYKIKHGTAVAIGLVFATKLSKKLGFLAQDFLDDLVLLLEKYQLLSTFPSSMTEKQLIDAMKHDKKRDNLGLKFVLPKKIGEVFVQYVDDKDIF